MSPLVFFSHLWAGSSAYLVYGMQNIIKLLLKKERINNQIRSAEVRVIDAEGANIGVMQTRDAIELAKGKGLDLIEINPSARPPIAKIQDFGKYQYDKAKKLKKARVGAKTTETKNIQIKVGTGDDALQLKAKNASKWLKEGHRLKVELYLNGRLKYMDQAFLRGRLERVLHFISEPYKVAEPYKKSPKGLMITIEREK